MKVLFVTFKPLEKELDTELRAAFERAYERSLKYLHCNSAGGDLRRW